MNFKYLLKQELFKELPQSVFCYWISAKLLDSFKNNKEIGETSRSVSGVSTGDNDRFMRLWFEVSLPKITFDCCSQNDFNSHSCHYVPCNKGGEFRKWYGNNFYVIKWDESNEFHRNRNTYNDLFFISGITWSAITTNNFNARYYPKGFVFDHASPSLFPLHPEQIYFYLGLLNSNVVSGILKMINPTINTGADSLQRVPICFDATITEDIGRLVIQNIENAKKDWDSFETSWDFKRHPLI